MAAKRFDPDRLAKLLEPQRFVLNFPEVMKGGISFVRPSAIKRLFEHVLIRTGKVAFAEAVISGASFTSCHPCVSEPDGRFRAFLSRNSEFQTSRLGTWAEAKAWQKQLVENADSYCKLMAADKGPVLARRLKRVFSAVDSYVRALGDIFIIFDREFAFLAEASAEEQAEVDHLATLARRMLYLN